MMNIAWRTRVSSTPCIRVVASDDVLHTSLVVVHPCDLSFRAFERCSRKYSLIALLKARRRSIILNWLVHLPVESRFARGGEGRGTEQNRTLGGEVGAMGQGRAEGESTFLFIF